MKKPVHAFIISIGLVFCLTPTYTSAQCWQQLGADFDGEEEYDNVGFSVALSSDGNTIAYGAPQNNLNRGKTTVFSRVGNSWIHKGTTLIGETIYEQNGYSLDLSADGNTIIIGSPFSSDTAQNCGAIHVFQWDGNNWLQQGSTIYGNQSGQAIGKAVSISGDGMTIAVGAPFRSIDLNNWSSVGLARVYRWTNGDWVLLGTDFLGQAEEDWFGSDVSLNSDGNFLAVSAKFSAVNGTESGYAKVFYWNATEWIQVGDDIIGEAGETMGSAIRLTPDANSLVIGAALSSDAGTGKGKIVVMDRVNGLWQQRGNAVTGSSTYARLGHSVGISDDGNIFVGGAIQGNGGGANSGQLQAYYWDGGSWQLYNEMIYGESPQNFFGSAADISGNGSVVAGGAYGNSDVAANAGHVRAFSSCVAAVSEQVTTEFTFYPNPSMGKVETDLGKFYQNVNVQVKNTLGQTFSNHTVSAQQLSVELPENPGTYFVEVKTETGTSTQKIIKL
jgi:hypothetical protein